MAILEKTNWTDPSDLIISDIYEYDMQRGGLSIIKEKSLLPIEVIEKIEAMDKHEAHIYIGNLQRSNSNIKDIERVYFKEYRIEFGNINNLTDDDIVSIKKDAIFVKRYCGNTSIGKYINFREKNHYHAFMRLPNLELFWNADSGNIDIKGINDAQAECHKEFLLKEISSIIRKISSYDYEGARMKLVRLMNDYKNLNLPVEFYREFNTKNAYQQIIGDKVIATIADVGDYYKDSLIIEYNYLNVLVPLLNLIS